MSEQRKTSIVNNMAGRISRRGFMAGAGAAALSLTVATPQVVRGGGSKVNLGLIGCGGRGTWIADLFKQHGGYNLVAVADYFQDRADSAGEKLGVPAANRFTGLSGYKKLLEKVDAVAIESPPYFHPMQAADAVEAGCHVYLAKPIAVDAPGCRSIGESGKRASQNKRCFLVDFQTRADPFYLEALKRLRDGALGDFVFGEAIYHANCPFKRMYDAWRSAPDDSENRLRAWGLDRVLSGDIITEQNIHTLDVMSWIMDAEPVSAVGTCGRTIRPVGTCNDHFSLLFEYPNKVAITFSSKQFDGFGTQPDGIRNRMFGSKGVLETSYGDLTMIRGQNFYAGGRSPSIYKDGAVANIATFHKSIVEGKFDNPTVEPSVRSNLVTILGRTAAYTGRKVMWNEIAQSTEKLDANLKGVKA
ncbi:MAG TPA: Gfo/Idh/MocA family oxidoreductase [Sedimentisphaerales bacterium]|nr:Gfo/Idh/MocA family oxidoreductase [Sedimentisphaerales bacterium]